MTPTLFDVTLTLADLVTEIFAGAATGGSNTTLIDSACPDPNDYYNAGCIWFRSGNNIGKTAIVSDYASASFTFTFATQTAACAAADIYSVTPAPYNRQLLRDAVNQALQDIGAVLKTDATLVGLANTTSYTLPAGVKNVKRVKIGTLINYNWLDVNGSLFFDANEPAANDVITLYYQGQHAVLSADANVVSAGVPLERLKWQAAVYALQMRYGIVGVRDPVIMERLKFAEQKAQEMRVLYGIKAMPRDPKHASWK